MSRATKKVQKAAKGDLQSGEELIEAVFLNPFGFTSNLIAKELGGVIGSMIARSDGSPINSDTGIAVDFPDEQMWMALTNQRLLVWSHSALSGKPKKLLHSIPASEVAAVTLDEQKVVHAFVMEFSDESSRLYEAPKLLNDAPAFATAVNA